VEHRLNDSDRGKSKRLGKTLYECHFATKLVHTYTGLGTTQDAAVAGRQLIAAAMTRTKPSASMHCVYPYCENGSCYGKDNEQCRLLRWVPCSAFGRCQRLKICCLIFPPSKGSRFLRYLSK
jgi:hypothetical protein